MSETSLSAPPAWNTSPTNFGRFSESDVDISERKTTTAENANQMLLSEFLQPAQTGNSTDVSQAASRDYAKQQFTSTPTVAAEATEGEPQLRDRPPSLADTINGAPKDDSIVINGKSVKIKSAERGFDGSRVIVLQEEYGVNPAGTKITFYDKEVFPQGKSSKYGNLLAVAEHPSGNVVYTKRDGNVIYDLAQPLKTDYPGGSFESKFFEELPNKTQLWRTTDGTMVERHNRDSLSTSKGNIDRIDFKNGKLTYLTQDSKTFTVEEQGGKMVVSELEGGRVKSTSKVDSFKESFDPPYNHPFYGAVNSRTRAPGVIKLDLGQRGECTIYNTPIQYDATRKTHSAIFDKRDGSTQLLLSDSSIIHTRPAVGLNERDWVKIESKPNRDQSITYKNGDYITKRANGDRIEGYKNGHATSLGEKVTEVQRFKDRNVYILADGGSVELPFKGGNPMIKSKPDGTQQLMKEDSVKEHFPFGQQTAYGLAKTLETKNTGETNYWLANDKEYSKITILGQPRNGFKGHVTMLDGTLRLITTAGRVVENVPLNEKGVKDYLDRPARPAVPPINPLDLWPGRE